MNGAATAAVCPPSTVEKGIDVTRHALVTGASGGIGKAHLPLLAARGYQLVLTGRDASALAAMAAAGGPETEILPADLTNPSYFERLADLVRGDTHLELLVNNAGVVEPGELTDLRWETLTRQIQINLMAPMRLTQAAAQTVHAINSVLERVDRRIDRELRAEGLGR